MIDGNIHVHAERIGPHLLEWTSRVDAAGSRIEWCITTDHEGWTSRYGPVHNQGVLFGSSAIASHGDEQTVIAALRTKVRLLANQDSRRAVA